MDRFAYTQRSGGPASTTRAARRMQKPWLPATLKRGLLMSVAVVALYFLFAQVFTKLYRPYARYLMDARERYQTSVAYIKEPKNICDDTEENNRLRLLIGKHYDQCPEAREVVQSRPWWTAFGRLMDDYELCKDTCVRLHVDPLSALGLVFVLCSVGAVLVVTLVIGLVFMYCYRQLNTSYELPFASIPMLHKVATALRTDEKAACTETRFKDD